ncbi:hypothetical protein IC575_020043 [Cucumis melo]
MDTLDENEVDIGEVQVGLCDNMIGTNSAIWESYESYHSKDDTFTWESVEMYNELFDIPEQRDAPTKDCKGKGKVDSSLVGSEDKRMVAQESSTSEELDVGQIFLQERFVNEIKCVGNEIFFVCSKKSTKEVLFVRCIDNKCGWRLRLRSRIQIYSRLKIDRETDDSIQWFLEKLKGAIGEVPNLGFVTDRKTCFAKGISSLSSAFHLCVQHLSQNLHDKYKNDTVATLFYNASRTYRESTFVEAWRHLLAFPNGSGKYLNDVGIARWSRVHCPGRRYNMMTTNIAQSMNSILKEPRDLPIASFLENVRALLQRWFWERREECIKVTSTLTKWAELVIQKKQERALTMKVNPIDCYQFHVKDLDKEEVVNLQTKECTCKEFQAEQLPCSHAIRKTDRNINVYSLCANYYTNECLLVRMRGRLPIGNHDWKTSEDYVHMTVLPPKVVKRVGRPKKKRIPSVGEAPKLHKCGRCKQIGHNRLTCTNPISYTDKSSIQD